MTNKNQEEIFKKTEQTPETIASQIGNFLGNIRFLSINPNLNSEAIQTILETRNKLINEIEKTNSKSLLKMRKESPQKEIFYLLDGILNKKNEEIRIQLTRLSTIRDQLNNKEKTKELTKIKENLTYLDIFSKYTNDEDLQKKIEPLSNYLK